MSSEASVCVVGAGPSGLALARRLGEHRVSYDVVERHGDVGGIWDIAAEKSPMYESAHFISSKTRSAFAGFPMPNDYPDYPDHRLILAYLRAFAERFELRRHCRFGVSVTQAAPADGGWSVSFDDGETRRYDALAVACGHQADPSLPSIPGERSGETIHSHAYTSADQLRGRRVLVVGGGNSGVDIALDAATHADAAYWSLRRGYHVVPKHIFGMPADVFATLKPQPPPWLAEPILTRLLRLLNGDLARFGMPRPDHRLFQAHPLLSSQLPIALSHGDLKIVGDVERFDGTDVVFRDGRRESIDLVICATGYRPTIPFLADDVYRTGEVSDLYLSCVHRRVANLFVVGLFDTDAGAYPLIDLQARMVAGSLAAARDRPEIAQDFAARVRGPAPDLTEGIRYLDVARMRTFVRSRPFRRQLERAVGRLGA